MSHEILITEGQPAKVIPLRNPLQRINYWRNQEVVYNPDLETALVFNGLTKAVNARSRIYVGNDFRYGAFYFRLHRLRVVDSEERLEFLITAFERSYYGLKPGDAIVRRLDGDEIKYELQRGEDPIETFPFDIVVADDPNKCFVVHSDERLTFHKTYDFFTSYTENDPNTWCTGRRFLDDSCM